MKSQQENLLQTDQVKSFANKSKLKYISTELTRLWKRYISSNRQTIKSIWAQITCIWATCSEDMAKKSNQNYFTNLKPLIKLNLFIWHGHSNFKGTEQSMHSKCMQRVTQSACNVDILLTLALKSVTHCDLHVLIKQRVDYWR